jgi:hypothetical protein
MRQVVQALVIVLILAVCGALGVAFVAQVRETARRQSCTNNFRSIGFAVLCYHDTYDRYPSAAITNNDLPPEQRLSWLVDLMPFIEATGIFFARLDRDKGWDAEENRFAALFQGRSFHCPGYRGGAPDGPVWASHYVGIAGIGEGAAGLPADDPRAGFFGYERTLSK